MVQSRGQAATDDQLAERVRAGDTAAFAALYERYVDRVYDFVARLLGDRDAAADVTQETFLKALQGLRTRRIQGSVRAWLFTIARNAAIDSLRRQRAVAFSRLATPEGEEWEPELVATSLEVAPEDAAVRRDLAELVWQAARSLPPQDATLLDLSLRYDLTPAELAQIIGARRGAVNTRLSRLRDALEESLTALLLARWGRHECPELDRLLDGVTLPEGLTPRLRRTVARHVERCEVCQRTRRRVVSAAELLPALAPVLPTPEVRAALDNSVQAALVQQPAPASSAPSRMWDRLTSTTVGKAILGVLTTLVVATGLLGGWLIWGTGSVEATTVGCPPLELRLASPAYAFARVLAVPEVFPPGETVRFALPAGTMVVTVTPEIAHLRLAGLPLDLQLRAPLAEVRWDGEPLLGRGTLEIAVRRGQVQRLELVCR